MACLYPSGPVPGPSPAASQCQPCQISRQAARDVKRQISHSASQDNSKPKGNCRHKETRTANDLSGQIQMRFVCDSSWRGPLCEDNRRCDPLAGGQQQKQSEGKVFVKSSTAYHCWHFRFGPGCIDILLPSEWPSTNHAEPPVSLCQSYQGTDQKALLVPDLPLTSHANSSCNSSWNEAGSRVWFGWLRGIFARCRETLLMLVPGPVRRLPVEYAWLVVLCNTLDSGSVLVLRYRLKRPECGCNCTVQRALLSGTKCWAIGRVIPPRASVPKGPSVRTRQKPHDHTSGEVTVLTAKCLVCAPSLPKVVGLGAIICTGVSAERKRNCSFRSQTNVCDQFRCKDTYKSTIPVSQR